MNGQNWPAIILHTVALLVGLMLGVFAFTYTGDGMFFALVSGMGGSLAVYLAAQLSRIAIKDK